MINIMQLYNSFLLCSITKLYMRPESHSTFEWICKNFGCSSSSVLFMKAEDPKEKAQREYIFIGDTRFAVTIIVLP